MYRPPFQFGTQSRPFGAGRIFRTANAKNIGKEKNHDYSSHERVRKEKRFFRWESDSSNKHPFPSINDHGAGMPTINDNRTDIVIDASNLGLTNKNKKQMQASTMIALELELRRRQGYSSTDLPIVVGNGQLRINSKDFLFRLSTPILARQAVQMKHLLVQRADGNQIACKVVYRQQQQGAVASSPPPPPPTPRRSFFNNNRRRRGYSNRPSAAAAPFPPPPPVFESFNSTSAGRNHSPPGPGNYYDNGFNNLPTRPTGRSHFHQPNPPAPLLQNSRAEALHEDRPSKRRRLN